MESPASDIARRLALEAEAVCRHYLSNGRKQGHYWTVGDVDNTPGRSFYVRLTGPVSGPGAAGKWTDAATGEHGDLLDLIAAALRIATLADTLDEARRFLSLPRPKASAPARSTVPCGSSKAARRLWALGMSIEDTLAERYLAGRGLPDLGNLPCLSFHPSCFYWRQDHPATEAPERWPALLAKVTDPDGHLTGLHRTWLDPKTAGKAIAEFSPVRAGRRVPHVGPRLSGLLCGCTLELHCIGADLNRRDMDGERDIALIDGFVRGHYQLPGVLRLHRQAIGWDLLRAPVNIVLAPAFLLARLVSIMAHLLRLRRLSRSAGRLRLQLRSDVGAVLEADLVSEVLTCGGSHGTGLDTESVRRLVREYVSIRSAVSEIGATLLVLLIGIFVFHAVTPGVISLAPVVTEHAAHVRDVAGFPLGQWLGGAWYGLFPGERPLWQILAVGAGLAVALSLVTAFSGILADPLQARLGIHRRRLRRLFRRIDRTVEDRPRIEGEFVLARGADIVDVATMVIRFLRS